VPTPSIRRSAAVALWTATLLPVLLLVVPGYLAWRDAVDGRRATVEEVRQNRAETIRNREIGVRMQRQLDAILERLPPAPDTRPTTQP
jgi:hypothetical protein